jgi:hypothetical protein
MCSRGCVGISAEPPLKAVSLDASKARLERLQRSMAGSETVNITKEQYLEHVKKLENDLYGAWARAERVIALRIAIQVRQFVAALSPHLVLRRVCLFAARCQWRRVGSVGDRLRALWSCCRDCSARR